MSILTHSDLVQKICSDRNKLTDEQIFISPCDLEKCLTPMSYDLRVGGYYRRYASSKDKGEELKEGHGITLNPGDTALVVTKEVIEMPRDGSLSAIIVSKASVVAMGFSGISTKIDPGWTGQLRVTVHNFSKTKLTLPFDALFCTIIFFKNNTQEKRQYTKRDHNPLGFLSLEKSNFPWKSLASQLLVLIIPGFVYWKYGQGALFTASIPVSIFIAQTIDKFLLKNK